MERKIKFMLILLLILLIASPILFNTLQTNKQEKDIKRLLNASNYCIGDSDCMILNLTLGCPFGCYNLGNKDTNTTKINVLWEQYQKNRQKNGIICVYSCIEPPKAHEIKCVNNKCIDIRYGTQSAVNK